jgi:hypothetical protein
MLLGVMVCLVAIECLAQRLGPASAKPEAAQRISQRAARLVPMDAEWSYVDGGEEGPASMPRGKRLSRLS